MMKIGCLLLAAGKGSRFGGRKQLAKIDGMAMVQRSLSELVPVFKNDTYVVLGAFRDEINPLIQSQCHILEHENWSEGIGTSIAFGINTLSKYDGVLIALSDQVALGKTHFGKLIARFDGKSIVAASYDGKNGVPVIFPSAYFDQLVALSGDQGAQGLLFANQENILSVDMPEARIDIDTPQDLGDFLKEKNNAA